MSTFVKVQPKGQMTIPRRVRSAVGLIDGDLVEVRAVGKKIVITPQLVIDRSRFLDTDNEYTPAQRRVIDARLAEGLADIEAGRVYGPFETHEAMMKSLRGHAGKGKSKTTKRARG